MGIRRLATVAQILGEEGLGYLTSQITGETSEEAMALAAFPPGGTEPAAIVPPERAHEDVQLARRLRGALERLGPTFVKFGQMLAVRPDLFSDEFCQELGKLHSKATPFSFQVVRAILEEDLRRPIDEAFGRIEEEPLAAASIAQVHAATLPNGEEVVVKVQRPEVREQMIADLEVLITVSGWLDRLFDSYRRTMIHRMATEFRATAARELDFRAEGQAAERFGELFRGDPAVKIPTIYADLSSTRVLVVERLKGVKLDEIKGPEGLVALGRDPRELARRMLRLQITQAYQHGFLHADMHPGNLFLLPDGRIGLIDFGMNVEVSKAVRDGMLRMLRLRGTKRYEEAIDTYLTIMKPTSRTDVAAFRKELLAKFKEAEGMKLEEHSLAQGMIAESRLAAKHQLMSPPELIAIARGLLIIEGIALRFAPEFQPYAEIVPIIEDVLRSKVSWEAMLDQIRVLGPDLLEAFDKSGDFGRSFLRVRNNFADTRSIREFLDREGLFVPPSSAGAGGWPIVIAFVLGAAVALGAVAIALSMG
jgi:ubiquinone biosynthesis protein